MNNEKREPVGEFEPTSPSARKVQKFPGHASKSVAIDGWLPIVMDLK